MVTSQIILRLRVQMGDSVYSFESLGSPTLRGLPSDTSSMSSVSSTPSSVVIPSSRESEVRDKIHEALQTLQDLKDSIERRGDEVFYLTPRLLFLRNMNQAMNQINEACEKLCPPERSGRFCLSFH